MSESLVQTSYGKVIGREENGVTVFRGIPFAAPPVGERRFRPPQDLEPWNGIFDASEFGKRPMQPDLPLTGSQEKSEDCLYLNIWAPSKKSKLLPVMVYIYGGAFIMGASSDPMYDGRVFAEKGDVILVSMNYRLGIFGFLYLGEIAGETNTQYASSGNCGLLDQIAALRWIKNNIEAFGGNPDNITVFGESAGAVSLSCLLVMPDTQGLFQKAIIQSTGDPAIPASKATGHARTILDLLEIQPDEVDRLLDVPAQTLLETSSQIPTASFWPVIDGISIPGDPYELAVKGAAKDIAVIIGCNKDEYALFSQLDLGLMQWDHNDIKNSLEEMFGTLWHEMADYYWHAPLDMDLYVKIMTYASFIYPTLKYTDALSSRGRVWSYLFSYEHPLFKAGHGMDLPFVWQLIGNNTFQIEGRAEEKLSQMMFETWLSFARHGDPNNFSLPRWPQFSVAERKVMVFDLESSVKSDPYTERSLWESLGAKEGFKNIQLAMANDVFLAQIPDSAQIAEISNLLPKKDGYYSVYDKVGDLLGNNKTEAVLYSMEDAFKTSDGKGIKINKIMMSMLSKMTMAKVAEMAGDKFPEGILANMNNELMKIEK